MRTPFWYLTLLESSLVVIGLVWAKLRGVPIPFRVDVDALGLAILASAVFSALNLSLYKTARRSRRWTAVFRFLENDLFPLFRSIKTGHLLVLVFLVGLGEEILFRGVLQHEIGLLGASVVFGVLHGPSRSLWPLALWATAMGACLGVIYEATGNLAVPVLAHALYDAVAIAFAKRLDRSNQFAADAKAPTVLEKDRDSTLQR